MEQETTEESLSALGRAELVWGGEWQSQNPLKIQALKIDESELSFLSLEQITPLLSCLTGDVYKVTLLCLATGARWTEAETIRADQLQPHRITYSATISGKVHVIPITPELYELLKIYD